MRCNRARVNRADVEQHEPANDDRYMNIHESLSKPHFTQLYFQAAKIRNSELAEFFGRYGDPESRPMNADELLEASEAAGELYEFLQRANMYLRETQRLGEESTLQRQ